MRTGGNLGALVSGSDVNIYETKIKSVLSSFLPLLRALSSALHAFRFAHAHETLAQPFQLMTSIPLVDIKEHWKSGCPSDEQLLHLLFQAADAGVVRFSEDGENLVGFASPVVALHMEVTSRADFATCEWLSPKMQISLMHPSSDFGVFAEGALRHSIAEQHSFTAPSDTVFFQDPKSDDCWFVKDDVQMPVEVGFVVKDSPDENGVDVVWLTKNADGGFELNRCQLKLTPDSRTRMQLKDAEEFAEKMATSFSQNRVSALSAKLGAPVVIHNILATTKVVEAEGKACLAKHNVVLWDREHLVAHVWSKKLLKWAEIHKVHAYMNK